jgi:L-seryl-tRNA(Ser) seleniumtransferase
VPRAEPRGARAVDRGLPFVEDLGSGALLDASADEPGVRDALRAGVDLVTFSGDKLLGGPQAGVACGRRSLVAALADHPLYRALRVDKVTLAALEATLGDHLAGRPTPVDVARRAPLEVVEARARALCARLGWGEVAPSEATVGGGSFPGEVLPSWAVTWAPPDPDAVARALRAGEPAVWARVQRGAVWLDLRTVRDDEVEPLARRLSEVGSGAASADRGAVERA